GVLPHRGVGGVAIESPGLDTVSMFSSPRRGYLLFGLEPHRDLAETMLADQALKAADAVICMTPYVTEELLSCADVLLPVGTFAETPGTFVNGEGRWQSFDAAASLVGEARPGWRVLRVLGNELGLESCDYRDVAEICAEVAGQVGSVQPETRYSGQFEPSV